MNLILRSVAVAALLAAINISVVAAADAPTSVVASMGSFAPNAIDLHVGETTTLHITSSEGVHYLKSAELGIPLTTIAPGSVTTVAITPTKAGTYVLHCAMFCGPGHSDMTITVTVVE